MAPMMEAAAIVPIRKPRDPEWPAAARLEEARALARMGIGDLTKGDVRHGPERWTVLRTIPGFGLKIGLRLEVNVEVADVVARL